MRRDSHLGAFLGWHDGLVNREQRVETSPEITPDLLGEPWVARRIPVTVNEEAAPGADHAVLVYRDQPPAHGKAVLYLHGRNDYFFQTWLAEHLEAAGFDFYALDLRACGRAGLGYPCPHDVRDQRVHAEEILEALRILREERGYEQIALNAHSTGGLAAVIFAHDYPDAVEALTLNSPWLGLNASGFMRSYGSAFVEMLSWYEPEYIILNTPHEPAAALDDEPVLAQVSEEMLRETSERPAEGTEDSEVSDTGAAPSDSGFFAPIRAVISSWTTASAPSAPSSDEADDRHSSQAPEEWGEDTYAHSLHRNWGGEWDWDLRLKPVPSVPVRAGFLAGVRRLQREVRHGLEIEIPILLCSSDTTSSEHPTREEALRSDVVLSVEQMAEAAPWLGEDVTLVQIPGGVHDLALSPEPARSEYFDVLTTWLQERLG